MGCWSDVKFSCEDHLADERSLSRELTLSQWMGEEFNA
jgi:hypothetical protein